MKIRQLRKQYNEETLKEIGEEMALTEQFGLRVEQSRLSVTSLNFLNSFSHLKAITIYEISKDISVLSNLQNLRSVALCSLSTGDVSFLSNLPHLEEIRLQGTRLKNWDSLRKLKQIKKITLFNVRQDDVNFLEEMESLQLITLVRCSKITVLPSLKKLNQLKRIFLDTVNQIVDISGIAQASNLHDIIIMGAKSLKAESFDCFIGHPTVKNILPGIGSIKSAKYKSVFNRIPSELLVEGFYGTKLENFKIQ